MEKLSGVRPALGQTRAHGGSRQNSQTESEEEKKKKKKISANSLTQQLFHSNLGLLNPKQRRVSAESQTNSSVRLWSSKPSKAAAQSSPCLQVASTRRLKTRHRSRELRGERKTPAVGSLCRLLVLFFFFAFAFARVFKKETTPKSSANSAFKNPFMRLPPKSTERNVFSSFCWNPPNLDLDIVEGCTLRSAPL